MTEDIEHLFHQNVSHRHNIQMHLSTLAVLCRDKKVTEIGFATGRSASAILWGGCRSLDSIDIENCKVPKAVDCPRFNLHVGSSQKVGPWDTEVLFVDGDHRAEAVKKDLQRWQDHASQTIILHDTSGNQWAGVREAAEEVLSEKWKLVHDFKHNNGLQVWEREL